MPQAFRAYGQTQLTFPSQTCCLPQPNPSLQRPLPHLSSCHARTWNTSPRPAPPPPPQWCPDPTRILPGLHRSAPWVLALLSLSLAIVAPSPVLGCTANSWGQHHLLHLCACPPVQHPQNVSPERMLRKHWCEWETRQHSSLCKEWRLAGAEGRIITVWLWQSAVHPPLRVCELLWNSHKGESRNWLLKGKFKKGEERKKSLCKFWSQACADLWTTQIRLEPAGGPGQA